MVDSRSTRNQSNTLSFLLASGKHEKRCLPFRNVTLNWIAKKCRKPKGFAWGYMKTSLPFHCIRIRNNVHAAKRDSASNRPGNLTIMAVRVPHLPHCLLNSTLSLSLPRPLFPPSPFFLFIYRVRDMTNGFGCNKTWSNPPRYQVCSRTLLCLK